MIVLQNPIGSSIIYEYIWHGDDDVDADDDDDNDDDDNDDDDGMMRESDYQLIFLVYYRLYMQTPSR